MSKHQEWHHDTHHDDSQNNEVIMLSVLYDKFHSAIHDALTFPLLIS
jgi:hypothetical protein